MNFLKKKGRSTIEKAGKSILFLLSAALVAGVFLGNDFGHRKLLDDFEVSADEYEKIISKRAKADTERKFNLKVDDYTLPFDDEEEFYLLSVNEDVNLEEYNPRVEVVSDQNLDYELALKDSDITPQLIEENEPLEWVLYTEDEYKEFTVHLTDLPIVSMTIDEPMELENSPIGDDNQQGSMTLYDNSADLLQSERTVTSDFYIRLRGHSSRAFDKKQYRINLREFTIGGDEKNNHLSFLNMREDDDWILYSPYNDPEKVRNTFSNNLWYETMAEENRFGIKNGIQGEFVEVFIGDRYWGIYSLMHPLDDKQVDLDMDKDPKDSEIYYRSVSNARFDPKIFEESTGEEMVLGRFELRDVDEPFGDKAQWKPLYNHFMARNSDKATLEAYLKEQTDLENQINYYLFTLLLQATDNNYKNHNYISKFDGETRVMLESPWDLDLTWGLHWQGDHPLRSVVRGDPAKNHMPSATLIHHALDEGSEETAQAVKEQYRKLRKDEWSNEAMMQALDEYEQDIYHSGSILRDKNRWPETAFNESMNEFRNYVLIRLETVDRFIEQEI